MTSRSHDHHYHHMFEGVTSELTLRRGSQEKEKIITKTYAMATSLKMFTIKLLFGKGADNDEREKNEKKTDKKEDLITRVLGPMESYVVELQSLLIWENPSKSIVSFIICNLFFWLAVYCQYRLYFLIASCTAITYIWRTWTRHIWPEIRVPVPDGEDTEEWTPVNPQVYSVPEISRYLSQAIEDYKAMTKFLIDFRRDHHGKFCAAASSFLLILWYVSRCVSGVFISYLIMCVIWLGPGFIVHVYPRLRGALTKSGIFSSLESSTIKVQEIDDPVEDYFPEPCEAVLKDLATALETSLFNEESNDSLMGTISKDSEDLVPSLNLMPSYDNDSDSGTEGEEAVPAILNVAETEVSRVSKEYVPAQFVDFDSDEDEEDKFARGLRFESEERVLTPPRLPTSSSSSSSASSTCSDQADGCVEVTRDEEDPIQIEKPPSRRPSQSDLELSDYEMISESELS